MYEYMGDVLRVVDGDTVIVLADLGFHVHVEIRLRLLNVFAAELKKRKADKDGVGEELKAWLWDWLNGQTVRIKTHSFDRYGRWLAEVWLDDKSVNFAMIGKIQEMEAQNVA